MSRTIDWLGIVRILLVQVLVLLALAGAVVWYVNWSSEAAWQEFIGANKPALAGPSRQPQSAGSGADRQRQGGLRQESLSRKARAERVIPSPSAPRC